MKQFTFVIGTPNNLVNRGISVTVVAEDLDSAQRRAARAIVDGLRPYSIYVSEMTALHTVKRTPEIVGKSLERFELR